MLHLSHIASNCSYPFNKSKHLKSLVKTAVNLQLKNFQGTTRPLLIKSKILNEKKIKDNF